MHCVSHSRADNNSFLCGVEIKNNRNKMSNQTLDASVVLVLDTNNNLGGQNIARVSNSVQEIIANSRPTVKFTVFVTSPTSKKLISEVKQRLNVKNLVQQINASCSSKLNSFYDAWGLALNEIPYDDKCYSHIVLFSCENDTGSAIYNLDSVMNLTNEKLSRNPELRITLIQAGPSTTITSALQNRSNFHNRCTCIIVQNSLPGITAAFEQVKSILRLELLQTSPYARLESQLNSLSMSGGPVGGVQVKHIHYTPNVVNVPFPSTTVSTKQRKVKTDGKPRSAPQPNIQNNACKVWVGNIPMVAGQAEILDYLMQWGPCKIETINGQPNQWAVVAYQSPKGAEYAAKYGNGSNFKGQVINVNKI